MEKSVFERMEKLFRTAFFVAIKERPFTDFPSLLELQEANGVNLGETYCNSKSCKLFIDQIAGEKQDNFKDLLNHSDYFSVMSDSSTDRSVSEKEIVYVRLIKDGYPTMKYLSLVDLKSADAVGIVKALDQAFSDFGFQSDEWRRNLVGFGADGAAVMLGKKGGIAKLQKDRVPDLIEIQCFAHKLELSVKDAMENTYFSSVVDTLIGLYYFYTYSPNRMRQLQAIADIMEEVVLKPEKAQGTRWIDHKVRALKKMKSNWSLIVSHLESFHENTKNKE